MIVHASQHVQRFEHDTWLQAEEYAYPNGGQTRKGLAIYPDGVKRRVWAGIPDTFYSIPAHGRVRGRYARGYLMVDDRLLDCPNTTRSDPDARYPGPAQHANGELHCELCQFGLVDSPTRGALIFHIHERSAT